MNLVSDGTLFYVTGTSRKQMKLMFSLTFLVSSKEEERYGMIFLLVILAQTTLYAIYR